MLLYTTILLVLLYPLQLLVIVIAIIAPAAMAAVAVAPVPVPFIKTVFAAVQSVPPVFTAFEVIVDVVAASVVLIAGTLISVAFEIYTLCAKFHLHYRILSQSKNVYCKTAISNKCKSVSGNKKRYFKYCLLGGIFLKHYIYIIRYCS